MEEREFALAQVLTGMTGRNLVEDFGQYYDLADFLYPGIGTRGLSMVTDHIRDLLLKQHPGLASVKCDGVSDWRAFLAEQEARFGATLTVSRKPGGWSPAEVFGD